MTNIGQIFKKIVNQALKWNNDKRDNYWQVLQWSLKMLEDLVHCNPIDNALENVLCVMCWQLGQYHTDNSINENNDESNALTAPNYQRVGTVNVVHFDNNKVTYNFWVSSNNFHDSISPHGSLRAKTKLKKIQSCAYRQHTGLIINKTSAKHFGKTFWQNNCQLSKTKVGRVRICRNSPNYRTSLHWLLFPTPLVYLHQNWHCSYHSILKKSCVVKELQLRNSLFLKSWPLKNKQKLCRE